MREGNPNEKTSCRCAYVQSGEEQLCEKPQTNAHKRAQGAGRKSAPVLVSRTSLTGLQDMPCVNCRGLRTKGVRNKLNGGLRNTVRGLPGLFATPTQGVDRMDMLKLDLRYSALFACSTRGGHNKEGVQVLPKKACGLPRTAATLSMFWQADATGRSYAGMGSTGVGV